MDDPFLQIPKQTWFCDKLNCPDNCLLKTLYFEYMYANRDNMKKLQSLRDKMEFFSYIWFSHRTFEISVEEYFFLFNGEWCIK